MEKRDPFKYFKTSQEIIRLAVMLYVRFPLSLRHVEDLLHERGSVPTVGVGGRARSQLA
jgi:putative transposase